jgi:hypothetical protein
MAKARQVEEVDDDLEEGQETEMDVMLEAMGLTDDEDESSRASAEPTGSGAAPSSQPATDQRTDSRQPELPLQQPQDVATLSQRVQHYEQAVLPHYQREHQRLGQELQQLRTSQQGLQQYAEQLTQFGLKPDEAVVGLQMAAAFRRAPAEYIRNLIQVARVNNVDLSALNLPNQGMDPQVYASVLDARLKPIMEKLQIERQQQELETQAQRDVQQFYTQYPDAPAHQNEIAILMNQMGLSAERAYWELKTWAIQNRLDWGQPLTAQWQARQAQPQAQAHSTFPANRRGTNYNTPISQPSSDQFDVNLNWKDVVKQAVAELNGV